VYCKNAASNDVYLSVVFLAKGKSVKSGSRKTSKVGGEKMSDSGLGTSIYDLDSGAVDNR
jgi:hypothetical protein